MVLILSPLPFCRGGVKSNPRKYALLLMACLLSAMVPLVLLFLKPNVWIGFRSASAPNGLGGPLIGFA